MFKRVIEYALESLEIADLLEQERPGHIRDSGRW